MHVKHEATKTRHGGKVMKHDPVKRKVGMKAYLETSPSGTARLEGWPGCIPCGRRLAARTAWATWGMRVPDLESRPPHSGGLTLISLADVMNAPLTDDVAETRCWRHATPGRSVPLRVMHDLQQRRFSGELTREQAEEALEVEAAKYASRLRRQAEGRRR